MGNGKVIRKRGEEEIKVHVDKANEMRARKQGQARARGRDREGLY